MLRSHLPTQIATAQVLVDQPTVSKSYLEVLFYLNELLIAQVVASKPSKPSKSAVQPITDADSHDKGWSHSSLLGLYKMTT